MPRTARVAPGGVIYHALNRGHGRRRLFHTDRDYAAFLEVLALACQRYPGVRLLVFCLVPTHSPVWRVGIRLGLAHTPRPPGELGVASDPTLEAGLT